MIWHNTTAEEALKNLGVDDKSGLPNGVADERLYVYGKNIITSFTRPTYLKRLSGQFKSKTVIVLIVIALLSFVVSLIYKEQGAYSSLIIVGIILINATVSAYYLYVCDNALDGMKSVTNPSATVLRDGILKSVNSAELVPGDIIILEEGDYISADARIIDSNEFRTYEAFLTGDEIPVEKNGDLIFEDITPVAGRSNMVFSGTSVAHGNAKAVVTSTALNTEIGRSSSISEQTGENVMPLENELDGISRITNILILIVCIAVFLIGMIQNFTDGNFASTTLKMLVNSVALAVAAIPEGLPAIATIVIALGIRRMLGDKIIIKDVSALKQLGKTDVICTDKTGVLTRNKMKLCRIFDGTSLTNVENEALEEKPALVLRLAAACSTLQNDSTEDAIKTACLNYNSMSEKDIESFFPQLAVIPFDSERKTMTVITMINEKPFAIVKGAPEIVVPNCVGCKKEDIIKLNNSMAEESLRIVCIAMRPLESIPANPSPEEIERDLTFVGLLGLFDPVREGVKEDIKACKEAGIRTLMITGDNMLTAKAVGAEAGILKDDEEAISGEEISAMTDEELSENVEKYTVFARVSPDDKLRIIKALRQNGRVVTATGYGIKDAKALSEADVGCAIGKFGADVARGNADVVIGNNRFGSVVSAIKEGRGLFDNIRKSVYYLLSCNLAELIAVLVGLLIFKAMPISAVQLLWINMLTDCAPAISLSMEKAEDRVMKKGPYTSLGKLFSGRAAISLVIQCIFMAAVTLVAYAIGSSSGAASASAMAFCVLGLSQIFHCYNNKHDGSIVSREIFSNRFMNLSAILTLFIVVFLCFTPAGYLFGMAALSPLQFIVSLLLSVLIVPICELIKLTEKIKN